MIWFGLFILVVIFVGLFLYKSETDDKKADTIALYKKQLVDLQQDQDSGILDAEIAASARLEIERRILRVAKMGETIDTENGAANTAAGKNLWLIALVLCAASMIIYWQVGRPDVEASPGQVINLQNRLIEEGGPTFGQAIEKIETHLFENPEDAEGLAMLAKTSRSVADFSRAAIAFGKLAELEPNNSAWRAQELEAYIAMASGKITPAAKLVLQKLLAKTPDHPAGQYYLGLTQLQAGDLDGAKEAWLALKDRSAADAPWMTVLNKQLSQFTVAPPTLSSEQISSVENMSVEERNEFVSAMISRLQLRLESQPNDPKGWIMLARSLLATKSDEAAIAALTKGLGHVPASDAVEMQQLLDNLRRKDNS